MRLFWGSHILDMSLSQIVNFFKFKISPNFIRVLILSRFKFMIVIIIIWKIRRNSFFRSTHINKTLNLWYFNKKSFNNMNRQLSKMLFLSLILNNITHHISVPMLKYFSWKFKTLHRFLVHKFLNSNELEKLRIKYVLFIYLLCSVLLKLNMCRWKHHQYSYDTRIRELIAWLL